MSASLVQEGRSPRFQRIDGGPCGSICGALPSTVELEQEALETGTCAELVVYAVATDNPAAPGSQLWIGWVCAGKVHGNLANSLDEGRRTGWYSK